LARPRSGFHWLARFSLGLQGRGSEWRGGPSAGVAAHPRQLLLRRLGGRCVGGASSSHVTVMQYMAVLLAKVVVGWHCGTTSSGGGGWWAGRAALVQHCGGGNFTYPIWSWPGPNRAWCGRAATSGQQPPLAVEGGPLRWVVLSPCPTVHPPLTYLSQAVGSPCVACQFYK
jgi:hypothetical protein